ncbi:MAG: hypothetical protein JSW56_06620 [Deltaproteobacteria bacterium]|nr:MAG: hypothetical protein JSW56_06620 [Deltaproteobacteria bacterium]
MNSETKNEIVEIIGGDCFEWLSREFHMGTQLKDIPDEILALISSVDITIRDYAKDRNAIVSIALITFAYKMADKVQHPKYGSNDICLLKVLAKNEVSRRKGKKLSKNKLWDAPLYELITGEVGEKIRASRFMTNPA